METPEITRPVDGPARPPDLEHVKRQVIDHIVDGIRKAIGKNPNATFRPPRKR